MIWRDWLLLVVTCAGLVALLEIVARTFQFGEDQRGWIDVVGSCVAILLFAAWRRWRGE